MTITTIITTLIGTNTYIIHKDNQALVIDPGSNDHKINDYLNDNNLDLLGILLTHGHFDHIGGVSHLANKYNSKIFLHELDFELVIDPLKNGSNLYSRNPVTIEKDLELIKLESNLRLGDFDIRVIHTPGHTKGSVAYLIENNLFSGDTLFKRAYGRYDLYGGDKVKLTTSLNKLLKLDKNIKVYPGHGDTTFIKDELNLIVY
ncbi:TPA: MBL fold metallo-hydrolase [bacterium]|nr:MBL fold metallo-hydrolase [bacterium]